MKLAVVLPLFTGIFLFNACTNKNNVASTTSEQNDSKVAIQTDTISPEQFRLWTNNWDSLGRYYSDTSLVKYYKMPILDLKEVLAENAASALYYQGLEPLGNNKYQAHLILCGVDSKGMIINRYFDVSLPCPPTCM